MPKKIRGVYQRFGQGEWFYDIQIRGHRFSGTTGCTVKRKAEAWIIDFRDKKKSSVAQFDGSDEPMSFGVASTRWWNEAGGRRKDAASLKFALAWLQREIGKGRRIDTIDNNLMTQLVTKRRSDEGRGGKLSPATVNRSMTEPLRAILSRAADLWGQRVQKIDWKAHKLKEPQERVREMTPAEEALLFAALRADFHPVARFLLITGLRRAEACGLTWDRVDMDGARIIVHGKGDTVSAMPMPAAALAILRSQAGFHEERVFTYVVRHPWGGVRGSRVPIDPDTLGTAYWRARRAAGLKNLKLHDFRHTAATRMLRTGANLKTVQRLLRHERINTTARYAHVTDDDLLAAMEATNPVAAKVEMAQEITSESRKPKSRQR